MKITIRFSHLLVAALAIGATWAFGQGALAPPGAPAPTMKSLDQVEARTALPRPSDSVGGALVFSGTALYHLSAGKMVAATLITG